MTPVEERTRCHGTGGFASGERNLRAKPSQGRSELGRDKEETHAQCADGLRTLSDVARVGGHAYELSDVP